MSRLALPKGRQLTSQGSPFCYKLACISKFATDEQPTRWKSG